LYKDLGAHETDRKGPGGHKGTRYADKIGSKANAEDFFCFKTKTSNQFSLKQSHSGCYL